MVAIASMKVLAFLYLYTCHISSGMCVGFPRFPSHLIMSPLGFAAPPACNLNYLEYTMVLMRFIPIRIFNN